jgi:hypothetical protein
MTPFTIAAKNAATLNLPDPCLRDYYFLSHLDFQLPSFGFPGIFSSFDARQKRGIHLHIDEYKKAPKWLGMFHDATKYYKVPRMNFVHAATNITVRGIPDEILGFDDGTCAILDYKTATYSNGQDALLPVYRGQLSMYRWLAEKFNFPKVSKLALVYFEPKFADSDDEALNSLTEDGLTYGMSARVIELEDEPGKVDQLCKLAREIYDLDTPPKGKAGCEWCHLMDQLYAFVQVAKQREQAYASSGQDSAKIAARRRFQNFELAKMIDSMKCKRPSDSAPGVLPTVSSVWDWSS